jgi:putative flippase GtrA
VEEKTSLLRVLFDKYREIIMYCIFGVVTTIVSWVVYSICELAFSGLKVTSPAVINLISDILKKMGDNTDVDTFVVMIISGIISWIIAVSVAFVTNKTWVFDSRSWERSLVKTEALTFYGGRILTGVIEIIAVPALVSAGLNMTLFGVDGLPAKIVVSVLIMILNYILSKFISFKGPKKEKT